jgi:hypothetical protein
MKVETLDALAWATLTEESTLAKLANALVKEHSRYSFPTQSKFVESIRSTKPPRGRAGPMLELLQTEYKRQHPIIWKRAENKAAWEAHLQNIANRSYRIQAAYASVFGKAIHIGYRHNPIPWQAPYDERHAWDEAEAKRPKGDSCNLLFLHQDCIVAVIAGENNDSRQQLKVRRRGSGYTTTTYLRTHPDDIGQLLVSLGGVAVTGALAHGQRVEIDYPGRKFIIHHADGDTHTAPWHIHNIKKGKSPAFDKWTEAIVMGRETISEETLE